MDEQLLRYYEHELRYLRELGGEFARRFPKIAARLGLSAVECADPHVERLLEGFAFMAARVHLQLDAQYPRFTQQLMEIVYPHYLAPTPSCAIVQFVPNPREGSLESGFVLPRGTALRTRASSRDVLPCEFRTCHEATLWPLQLEAAQYTSVLRELSGLQLPAAANPKALLKLRLRVPEGLRFDQLALETLPLYLHGSDEIAFRLHEQLATSALGLYLRAGDACTRSSDARPVRPLGFAEHEAMFPYGSRSFSGYRLLHEYFAFPSRFNFIELRGLAAGVRRCAQSQLELLIPLGRYEPLLETSVDAARFAPFAVPAVNLFPRECDRAQLSDREHAVHIVPDRTRPLDYEVHTLRSVTAYGAGLQLEREFRPLYALRDRSDPRRAYYSVERRPRVLPVHPRRTRSERTHYAGSEVFLTLVDGERGSHGGELRQLGVEALCTNRDLPLLLGLGQAGPGASDFGLQTSAPLAAIRCIGGPTAPRPARLDGDTAWRLISHLSLNYLSVCDERAGHAGAESLREMLALYAELGDPLLRRQVDGVCAVASRPVTRPLPGPGPRSFGSGIEVQLECEEQSFQGTGPFALGAVLSAFFARHAAINSFTETVLRTRERGEVFRWPTTAGLRHTL